MTPGGLRVAGRAGTVPLVSGAMHYWRVPPDEWRACLRAMRALGLGIVETYVPWGVHEERPGRCVFRGERDLGAFLDAVAGEGMLAIVRPGPHINAELTWFGFPERVLRDEAMLARTSRGTPVWLPAPPRMFPVPSYASAAFRAAVCDWFAAVGEVVAPRVAPDGPVVAVQVDNELQMFFRIGAYDADYHPDAVAWWDESAAGEAPVRWDPAIGARCARWVGFKDQYTARALAWMVDGLSGAGLGDAALTHNLPPSEPEAVDLVGAERVVDACGMDFYHRARDRAAYRRRALWVAGSARLPYAPELGAGGPPWLPPMAPAEQLDVALGVLGAGVRGFNLYMAVDRERWYGAPIGDDGRARPHADGWRRLLAAVESLELPALRRRPRVGVVLSRADWRFGVASALDGPASPVVTELLSLGPAGALEAARDDGARVTRQWQRAVLEALERAGVPATVIDEGADPGAVAGLDAVVLPTAERAGRAAWRLVTAAARAVLGPGKPTADEWGEPLGERVPRGSGRLRADALDDLDGLAADLRALVPGDLPWSSQTPDATCDALYADGDDAPRALVVGNRTARRITARLDVPAGATLRDALTDVSETPVSLELAPWQTRLLAVVT